MAYKAKSITSKASSACKMNMGLVQGEADVQNSKAFVNYGEMVQKKIDAGGGKTTSKDASVDLNKESGGDTGGDKTKSGGQSTNAVNIPGE